MFYEDPKVRVSRRVAAFMYGNGVSVRDAAKFYKTSQAELRNVSETHMYGWYKQWDKAVPSTLFYYYTKKKWVIWLGKDERVELEITVRNFGPATSERAIRINQRISNLRWGWSGGKV